MTIVLLVPRCDDLYREEVGCFKLGQVSLRDFSAVGLRKHAPIYTYTPFVRLQNYFQEVDIGTTFPMCYRVGWAVFCQFSVSKKRLGEVSAVPKRGQLKQF